MEWSLNIKSKLLVEFSLSWFSLPFVSIDNVPLLVDTVRLFVNANVSVFLIKISLNLKNLSSLINNCSSLVSE